MRLFCRHKRERRFRCESEIDPLTAPRPAGLTLAVCEDCGRMRVEMISLGTRR